jgi:CheY-like chemotaxis protein
MPVLLPTSLKNYRVLYVEDEPLIAMDGEAMLRELGFDDILVVLTYADAEAAIEREHFDLALMDVNLGGGRTSIALAGILAERNTTIVFTSGYNGGAGIATTSFGVHLEKPFDQPSLLRAVLSAVV